MKETFLYSLRAILPILFIIVLGYVARRVGPWQEAFFKQLNKLCFQLFLPIQLFFSVYSINDLSAMNWRIICYLFLAILLCASVGILASKFLVARQEQKSVIVQASFRSNQAILGLPLANALGGEAAMAFASLATSIFVPLYNVLAVVILTSYSIKKRPSIRSLLHRVVTNPLIISSLSALVLVALRQFLPAVGLHVFTIREHLPSLYQALSNLSKVASPVMLFVLGARLDLGAIKGLLPQLTLGTMLRLVINPLWVIGLAVLLRNPLNLTTLEIPTLIAVTSTPVAVSSAVMVQEIGGDNQLASQLVVWTSVLSMASIFCIVCLLRTFGLL